MTPRRPFLALLAVAAAALGASPAAAAVATGPSGDAFYTPPKKLPGKTHGDPIWIRKLTNQQTLAEAKVNESVLYRSTSVRGKTVAVSGTIHLPKGKAPRGGWPVVSWAHATSGLGDQCAPSRNPGEGAIHAYHVYIEALLDRWLKAGFAVVRTDYEGLGTKGVHPYLVGVSEGRGVLDIVRAARKVHPGLLSTRFAIGGHSQGGHAAVFATALARKWVPELSLRGTTAFAPFSQGDEIFASLAQLDQPSRVSGYAALFVRGIEAGYPQLGVTSLLSQRGADLYPLTLSVCIDEITSESSEFAKTAPRDLFREGADLEPIRTTLAANDPTDLKLTTPLLVEQGSSDTTVNPNFTQAMVAGLRKSGAKVTLKLHENIDHTTVAFGEPQDEAFSWVSKRLR
ncbi:MAG TPA: lipase family protein [Thermoleophilaceae bacterium]|jgi:acetyl esterase/lipase